jgi:hypothetical protein
LFTVKKRRAIGLTECDVLKVAVGGVEVTDLCVVNRVNGNGRVSANVAGCIYDLGDPDAARVFSEF